MSISLHDLTVPVFLRGFQSLGSILEKGRQHADAQGLAHSKLLEARLFPDMAPLTAQVQRASDTSKGAVVRLGAVENVAFEDNEKTFDELQARIAKTCEFLRAVTPAQLEERDSVTVTHMLGGTETLFSGRDYVISYVLPNFFFHVTTAYALLRQQGVPIGKSDYLGSY